MEGVEQSEEASAPPASADVESDLNLTDLLVEMKDYLEKTDIQENRSDGDANESMPVEEVAETGG